MRILQGQGDIRVTVHYANGENIESDMLAGIGIDLRNVDTGEPFVGITFRSSQTETIKVLVSNFPTTDSRLVGDINVQGELDTVSRGGTSRSHGGSTFTAGVANVLLPPVPSRIRALIQFEGDVYLGSSNSVTATTGIYVPAGSEWIDTNRSWLWAYAPTASKYRIIEDHA